MINTYTEAVQTVEVEKAVGKPHQLWVEFSKFYETNGQLAEVSEAAILVSFRECRYYHIHTQARVILEKAVKVPYRTVDDLATVWCEFAEMELRHE